MFKLACRTTRSLEVLQVFWKKYILQGVPEPCKQQTIHFLLQPCTAARGASAMRRSGSRRRTNAGSSSFLFLIANIVTTSKALVTSSDALVPSSYIFGTISLGVLNRFVCVCTLLQSFQIDDLPNFSVVFFQSCLSFGLKHPCCAKFEPCGSTL